MARTHTHPMDYRRRQAPPSIEQLDRQIEGVDQYLEKARLERRARELEPEESADECIAELDRFYNRVSTGEIDDTAYRQALKTLAQNYGLVAS